MNLIKSLVRPLPERIRAWTPGGSFDWLLLVLASMLLPILTLFSHGYVVIGNEVVEIPGATVGDYDIDAGLALERVKGGELWELYGGSHPPLMMPLSLVLRLLALLVTENQVDEYRVGVVLCLLVAGLVAFIWREWWQRVAWILLVTLNPLTFEAIQWGHPEEVLMGALIVGGLVASSQSRVALAGVLVGLALATKQPAIFALPVVVLASPRPLKTLGWSCLTFGLVAMPWLVPHAQGLFEQHRFLASGSDQLQAPLPGSLWTLFGGDLQTSPTPSGELQRLLVPTLPAWVLQQMRLLVLIGSFVAVAGIKGLTLMKKKQSLQPIVWPMLFCLMVIRAALDTQMTSYYMLTAILVLMAWGISQGRVIMSLFALALAQLLVLKAGNRAYLEILFTTKGDSPASHMALALQSSLVMILIATTLLIYLSIRDRTVSGK